MVICSSHLSGVLFCEGSTEAHAGDLDGPLRAFHHFTRLLTQPGEVCPLLHQLTAAVE